MSTSGVNSARSSLPDALLLPSLEPGTPRTDGKGREEPLHAGWASFSEVSGQRFARRTLHGPALAPARFTDIVERTFADMTMADCSVQARFRVGGTFQSAPGTVAEQSNRGTGCGIGCAVGDCRQIAKVKVKPTKIGYWHRDFGMASVRG